YHLSRDQGYVQRVGEVSRFRRETGLVVVLPLPRSLCAATVREPAFAALPLVAPLLPARLFALLFVDPVALPFAFLSVDLRCFAPFWLVLPFPAMRPLA